MMNFTFPYIVYKQDLELNGNDYFLELFWLNNGNDCTDSIRNRPSGHPDYGIRPFDAAGNDETYAWTMRPDSDFDDNSQFALSRPNNLFYCDSLDSKTRCYTNEGNDIGKISHQILHSFKFPYDSTQQRFNALTYISTWELTEIGKSGDFPP